MFPEWTLQAALTIVLAIVAWALKRAIGTVDKHTQELADIRLELARDYVKRADLEKLEKEQQKTTARLNRVLLYIAVIATKLNVSLPAEERDET